MESQTFRLPAEPLVVIQPSKRWSLLSLKDIWAYRELLFFLTWRDVKVRYKQTALGAAWAILQPLFMMIIFTIFFGRISLPGVCARRTRSLDVLFQRDHCKRKQSRRQRQPDHEGLLSTLDRPR